ncbi:putative ditrans,polycis-polyprenyl diphosphate synthase ((2E,6E)-farnesyl diphosphate specific) [Rosa chinensis]|uniref:ditrans,polycis-polyprenyl diphosphate synthase [(2E,6E)-farnesyldiphosphate specific] n=1 Tax=Rosa chinensis TaxID=74649 RepID=A0A2P6PP09_ROSCH|nr:dehydrodolichyl diphosphate synthase complex subunit NUS1 [Rosa chinensis]PRQ23652.1 putative ditrans,polycis-polyprenyl diphosphate synthase ((2E,6E)-farnesyl diphosphate specific) [Rosa chinensis]
MDLKIQMQRARATSFASYTGNLGLLLLWHILHLLVRLWYFLLWMVCVLESYLISGGILKKYKALNVGKLRYLAIVVESEEAYETSKVIELLQWLEAIGVKRVCLYDTEGVLKKSKEVILTKLKNAVVYEDGYQDESLVDQIRMSVEFCSFSDGKEAITKAANLLFVKYLKLATLPGDHEEKIFTEPHMDDALKAIGGRGPDPDLLLVYGPARCHLGFPAWRMRYTEIVHMGQLMHMRYGSLIKAIYRFTTVRQNYGK